MVVDKSAHGDLLRVNFNISFPALPCEFASLDVSDALGTVRSMHAVMAMHAWQLCSCMRCCAQCQHIACLMPAAADAAEEDQFDKDSEEAANQ